MEYSHCQKLWYKDFIYETYVKRKKGNSLSNGIPAAWFLEFENDALNVYMYYINNFLMYLELFCFKIKE